MRNARKSKKIVMRGEKRANKREGACARERELTRERACERGSEREGERTRERARV